MAQEKTEQWGQSWVKWMLFCKELDTYVRTESIQGGPYMRLENVDLGQKYKDQDYYFDSPRHSLYYLAILSHIVGTDFMRNFTEYYLKHGHLKFNYMNGSYSVGMPFYDFIVDISNAFIEYLNKGYENGTVFRDTFESLKQHNILKKAFVSNGIFYKRVDTYHVDRDINAYQGTLILTFKGEEKNLKIYDDERQKQYHDILIMDRDLAIEILIRILRTLNFRYTNNHYEPSNAKNHSEDYIAATCENVRYL